MITFFLVKEKFFLQIRKKMLLYIRGVKMKNNKNLLFIGAIILFLLIIFWLIISNINKTELTEITYNQLVTKINNKDSFVLCISRTTCSHCNDYKPKLNEVAKENSITIYYIDVDKYDEEEFSNLISFDGSTPTTIFVKNGEEETTSNRINGDVTKSKIIEKLKSNGFIN